MQMDVMATFNVVMSVTV